MPEATPSPRSRPDTGVSLQVPLGTAGAPPPRRPQARASSPRGAGGTTRLLAASLVVTSLVFAHVLFTLATMVPEARSHFLDLLVHPAPTHFLKGD